MRDHKTWRGLLAGVVVGTVSMVYVPPLLPTLACLPIVLAGSIAVTAVGWALGLKEAWI